MIDPGKEAVESCGCSAKIWHGCIRCGKEECDEKTPREHSSKYDEDAILDETGCKFNQQTIDFAALRLELQAAQTIIAAYSHDAEVEALSARVHELSERLQAAQDMSTHNSHEVEKRNTDIVRLKAQLAAAREQVREKDAEIASFHDQLDKADDGNTYLRAQLAASQREIAAVQQQSNSFRLALEEMQNQRDTLQAQLREKDEEIERLKGYVHELNSFDVPKELFDCRMALIASQREMERLKEIELDAVIRLDDRQQRIDRLAAENDRLQEGGQK